MSTNELHRVTVLLDYGASVDDRGRYGLTALHYAVRGGKLPLIKLLLERGASANALDEDGLTPLLHLSKTRSKADPIPVMELLAASGANVDERDETQGTLLMYFARRGKAEPVQWLLAHGADRNARNQSKKTAAEIGRRAPGDRVVAHEMMSRSEYRSRYCQTPALPARRATPTAHSLTFDDGLERLPTPCPSVRKCE